MKTETIDGIKYETTEAEEQPAPGIDFSKMKEGFLLSRIDVKELEVASEDTLDVDAVQRELSKSGIDVVAIDKEDREKFGLDDHPLHKEHLAQAA